MLYTYSCPFGQFALIRTGVQWHVEFNDVPIGQQYGSAEQALGCLVRGFGFGGTLSELVKVAEVPADIARWMHFAVDPVATRSMRSSV
jgi:hypothetical protein